MVVFIIDSYDVSVSNYQYGRKFRTRRTVSNVSSKLSLLLKSAKYFPKRVNLASLATRSRAWLYLPPHSQDRSTSKKMLQSHEKKENLDFGNVQNGFSKHSPGDM